ncbi:tetratricopeptide repeat protein [Undibacterium sp. Di27W]|uniref:tetratricopeptide repeat protein n=1 Tax=Undibacterium sp. Di27W TaxID=3413036 RepID=UPI003BF34DBC
MTIKKLNRNDPCVCGSGKKYKQCCMLADELKHSEAEKQKQQISGQIAHLLEQGMLMHRNAQIEDARKTYQAILQLNPSHPDALHLYGVTAHQMRNYGQAIQFMQLSLQSNPGNFYALNNLGAALRENNQAEQALQCFQQACKLKPDYAEAHSNIGNVYKDTGNLDKAILAYRHAISLSPAMAEPWNNLALIYQKNKDLQSAIQCAERAAALQPDMAEIHNTLGNIYKDAGQLARALASYQQALALDPQQGNAAHFINVLSGQASAQAPVNYVSKVFDDYAERFDQHLQEVLEYKIPTVIGQQLRQMKVAGKATWRILDLGCGTGLVAQELASMAEYFVGVDLSEKMLLKAQERKLYRRLIQADLLSMTRQELAASYELVTAADVFVYLGQLDAIVAEISRLLVPDGLFAFSIEAGDANQLPGVEHIGYQLRNSGRYAHQLTYLQSLAAQHGFTILQCLPQTIRMENLQAIPGYLLIWRKLI